LKLIFYIILFGVAYLLYHLYGKKLLKQGPSGLIKPALITLGVLLLLAALTGRANALFAIIGGLLASAFRLAPLVLRFYPQIREILLKFGINTPAGPGSSLLRTATLSMTVDQTTGKMDGEIVAGEYRGSQLSALSIDEITRYHDFCRAQDPDALRLIEAYVKREHPDEWHKNSYWQSHRPSEKSTDDMSVQEAQDVLGLSPGASKQEIAYAHRKLMSKLHPDKGGSTYLATRVNQAKDLLIAQLSK